MNNNSFFSKPASLFFFEVCAAILAAGSVYFCFIDDFAHSLTLLFNYGLLLILIFVVGRAFIKGEKEIVKIGTASIFTLTFLVFAESFVDIIYMNNYFLFSDNYVATIIGIIAILILIVFIFAYSNHFAINKTNASDTRQVNNNVTYLIWTCILCFAEAGLVGYNDFAIGRKMEWFLVLTYCMHAFVCLMLITVEVLINNFRVAREMGKLDSFAKDLVGEEAANTANGKVKRKTRKVKTAKKNK